MDFRALIVDDEETYSRSLMRLLGRRGVAAHHAGTAAEGLTRARRGGYDLIVLDHLLPDGSGLDLIGPLRALTPAPRVLMMTAFGTIENAVEAMRRGADDYITKSTAIDNVVERVLDARRLAEALPARPDAAPGESFPDLLGDSPAMQEVRTRIGEVARAPDTTVLLVGESGSGKGVAARAIHALGARPGEPFVVVDCVSLPPTLAESELFGHEKGAFTGADRVKPGKFEIAGRGTVLLDEIGDMEPQLQGKLLRVLEERSVERVGGIKPVPLGARVIAASHRDLSLLVEEKRFRLDLFHRLMVFPISLPPLRARGEDVVLLADHFLAGFGARLGKRFLPIPRSIADVLLRYPFPGNVRELKNVIERAAILSPGGELTVEALPSRLLADAPRAEPTGGGAAGTLNVAFRPGADTLESLERRLLEEALRASGGKKQRAAELLGISRFALMRRVEKYHL